MKALNIESVLCTTLEYNGMCLSMEDVQFLYYLLWNNIEEGRSFKLRMYEMYILVEDETLTISWESRSFYTKVILKVKEDMPDIEFYKDKKPW